MNNVFKHFSSVALTKNQALNTLGGGSFGGKVACGTCSSGNVYCDRCAPVKCGNSDLKAMNCGKPLASF